MKINFLNSDINQNNDDSACDRNASAMQKILNLLKQYCYFMPKEI